MLGYDLFCGAGGCSRGYMNAGFTMIGVDKYPQPRYCGSEFIQMDALEFLRRYLSGEFPEAAFVHASPPCQEYSSTRYLRNYTQAEPNMQDKLIKPVRDLLMATGKPYVIENVTGSPLPSAIELCGSMFGLPIRRHRLFEASFLFFAPGPCRHTNDFYNVVGGKVRGYGGYASLTRTYTDAKGSLRRGEGFPGKAIGVKAFEIDWMTVKEMSQSVPPIYTEWIGRQLMMQLEG